ncbi:hypothetical protein DW701_07000 [Bacteroides eggerthii]|uniref:Uncharacterized protein n=1 Tax=Bacteroides eggerthii TaxID=28111 RepID=A0A414ME87_9BACE|nr:hypothetical protein DW701_07000 [Bacteroides eggerthii]RHH20815.1 hypothetical protein DW218_15540 [Bacteroides eggerthii]
MIQKKYTWKGNVIVATKRLILCFVAMWKVFFERSFDKRKDTSVFIIGKIFDVNKWMIYFYLDTLL